MLLVPRAWLAAVHRDAVGLIEVGYPAALVRSREDTAAGPVLFSICWTVKPMAATIASAALAFVVHEWLA